MTKKDDENFESHTKYWIRNNAFDENDVKVRDHSHKLENIEVLQTEIVMSKSV